MIPFQVSTQLMTRKLGRQHVPEYVYFYTFTLPIKLHTFYWQFNGGFWYNSLDKVDVSVLELKVLSKGERNKREKAVPSVIPYIMLHEKTYLM